MNGNRSLGEIIAGLNRLAASRQASHKAKETAQRLVERLSSPVRVALLGRLGAGKTTLRDVIAGAPVVPADAGLPTSELRFGKQAKIVATLSDGSKRDIDGLDFAALARLPASFVELHAPLPALHDVCLLEVATKGTPKDLRAAANWAARESDIAIWVTRDFGPEEREIWRKLPDSFRDHGYLVLSQVDTLASADRARIVQAHQDLARDEFLGFFPMATKQALSAVARETARDAEVFKASGCGALIDRLMQHVGMGNQADLDGALMFLSRHQRASASGQRPSSRAKAPAAHGRRAAPEADRAAVDDRAAAMPSDPTPGREARPAGPEAALSHIRLNAETMLEELDGHGGAGMEFIIERCVDAIEELSMMLPDDIRAQEAVLQAADVITLLQLEKRDTAAEDAALVLLQLKREFETAVAA